MKKESIIVRNSRKIARIDPDIAERLSVSAGDALELSSGRKKSTVLSWPSREGDRGLIRVDGFITNGLVSSHVTLSSV